MDRYIEDLEKNKSALEEIIVGLSKLNTILAIPNVLENEELNQDARLLFIDETGILVNSVIGWYNLYNITKLQCESNNISFLAYIKIPYNSEHFETEVFMLERLKRNFIVDYCFYSESLIGSIVYAIKNDKKRTFYQNCEELKNLNLLSDKDILNLKVLSSIRNCLHNNGIHKNDDFDTIIDGVKYKFIKGQQVDYGGWGYNINATIESLRVIENLLKNEIIKKIPFIIDEFASATN